MKADITVRSPRGKRGFEGGLVDSGDCLDRLPRGRGGPANQRQEKRLSKDMEGPAESGDRNPVNERPT